MTRRKKKNQRNRCFLNGNSSVVCSDKNWAKWNVKCAYNQSHACIARTIPRAREDEGKLVYFIFHFYILVDSKNSSIIIQEELRIVHHGRGH
jgi:hypothetical protein